MADSNSVAMRFKAESSYGVDPGGNGKGLRFASCGIKNTPEYKTSDEIVSSREVSDHVLVDVGSAGPIDTRMSYSAHDDFLVAALCGAAFAGAVTVGPGTTFAAVASGNHITDSGNGFGSVTVGSWLYISGFATAGNNGFAKVTAKASSGDITISGLTLTNESAGASVTIKQADKTTNGSTFASFCLEKQMTDLSSKYEQGLGQVIEGFDLRLGLKNFAGITFNWTGKPWTSGTATIMGTPTAAPTADLVTTVRRVVAYFDGYSLASVMSLSDFSLKVTNNTRNRPNLGSLGPESVGLGTFLVTGGFKSYFTDATVLDLFRNDTYTSIAIRITDANNKGYLFELPSIKFTAGSDDVTGQNSDQMNDMTFGSRKDPTAAFTLRIHRFN